MSKTSNDAAKAPHSNQAGACFSSEEQSESYCCVAVCFTTLAKNGLVRGSFMSTLKTGIVPQIHFEWGACRVTLALNAQFNYRVHIGKR
jgi:hypothetical protein